MAFTLKTGNIFNRHYAHKVSTQDIYVSGFYGLYIELPPIFDNPGLLHNNSIAKKFFYSEVKDIASNRKELEKILASAVFSVDSVPESTLNVTQKTGMGGITAAVPTNIAVGNTIGVTFNEFFNTPLTKIFRYWMHVIRGGVEGVSALGEGNYKESNYAGIAYYWPLAPNGLDIQMVYTVSGVFPDRDPSSLFTNSNADSSNIQLSMNFHCGRARLADPKAIDRVKTIMQIIDKDRQALISSSEAE